MKIVNTKTACVDFKGEVMKDSENNDVKYGVILSNIMGASNSNPSLAWVLGKKFATEDKVELKAEDVVFVKKCIQESSTGDKAWLLTVIAGQLLEMLDATDKPEK